MTAGGLPVALVAPVVPRYALTPTFLVLAATAGLLTVVLYTERPVLSRRAVVSLVPWMIVASALAVLAARVAYPPMIQPAVTGAGAYLTTYVLVGLVWFALLQFARGARRSGGLPSYLGAMGLGAAIVVVSAILLTAGALDVGDVFWLAVAPIAAAVVAAVVLVLLGLWYTEAAAYTGVVGGLVVFGHALAAIATALAVVGGGEHTLLSWLVLDALATVGAAAALGLDPQLLWAWGLVWTRLLLATAVVVALSTYTHRHPTRGNLVLGLVAALGIVQGVTALLAFAVGA